MTTYPFDFPYAHQFNRAQAIFRKLPEDFLVAEELGFELSGDGEHLWLYIEKTDKNTLDVARELAALTGSKIHEIGYAGLKDKHAISRQWFSVKSTSDLSEHSFSGDGVKVLEQQRNSRKLRQGSHKSNRFVITLKDIEMNEQIIQTISETLSQLGVPNYFGLQRFGNGGNNMLKAQSLFTGKLGKIPRFQRGMYLSAARSYLFNSLLATRVHDKTWDNYLPGDVMALAGSSSFFKAEPGDTAISGRLSSLDIHPTGPLWGTGALSTSEEVNKLEAAIAVNFPVLAQGLEAAGLKQERRSLRLVPEKLSIKPAGDRQLVVEFSLPKGTYATSILREIVAATGL